MNLLQRAFNFPASNPVRSIRDWFAAPRPALGAQPNFGTIVQNLTHSPNFNGAIAPTVPQTAPTTYYKTQYLGGLTRILSPRQGPTG